MIEPMNNDAFSPLEIARRVENLGVTKAHNGSLNLLVLAILAGAFISMGALFYLVVTTDSNLGFGVNRLIGGICFSLGLILVVIAGAELFTGNNLIAMAWASKKISTASLLRNWTLVYCGNIIGCLITVVIAKAANLGALSNGNVAASSVQIALTKSSLTFEVIFARGMLCNALVCIAIWISMGGHTVSDKILAIIFPISAFVALGLEHSIANWFFLPYGMLVDSTSSINISGVIINLIASTLGNIVGGTVLVSGVYWLVYLRQGSKEKG